MKNLTLTLVLLVTLILSSFAQKAINVGLLPVQATPNTLAYNFNNSVSNIASQCLAKNKRIHTVERKNLAAIMGEIEDQTHEAFDLNSGVKQFQLTGANYLMNTEVLDCSINKAYNKDENNKKTSFAGYQVKINVSMNIIDVETGVTLASKTVPSSSYVRMDIGAATLDAIKSVESDIENLIKEAFPIELQHQSMAQKNNKAKDIILNGGTALGIKKGDRLEVFVVNDSGFERQIGVVRVKALNGSKFCTAIPTQKAKNILKHSYDKKTRMVFRSCNRGSFMDGLEGFSKAMDTTSYALVSEGTMKF